MVLANHKSALKRNRQNEKRNERNKVGRTRVKNAIKSVLQEIDEKNTTGAQNALKVASKVILKYASKGTLHKKAASRKVAGLSRKVSQFSSLA